MGGREGVESLQAPRAGVAGAEKYVFCQLRCRIAQALVKPLIGTKIIQPGSGKLQGSRLCRGIPAAERTVFAMIEYPSYSPQQSTVHSSPAGVLVGIAEHFHILFQLLTREVRSLQRGVGKLHAIQEMLLPEPYAIPFGEHPASILPVSQEPPVAEG